MFSGGTGLISKVKMLPLPHNSIPGDIEWIVLKFLDTVDFYSTFTTHLLLEQLKENMISGLAEIVLNFTLQDKEFYSVHVAGIITGVVYVPHSISLPPMIAKNIKGTTFSGADFLLGDTTREEERYFRGTPQDQPGSLPTLAVAYIQKNINTARFLIKLRGEVTYAEWRERYYHKYEPDFIQRRIIDLMVRSSSDETLLKIERELPADRIKYRNVSIVKELLRRSDEKSKNRIQFSVSFNDFLDFAELGENGYLKLIFDMGDFVAYKSPEHFIGVGKTGNAVAMTLFVNDERYARFAVQENYMGRDELHMIQKSLVGTKYHSDFVRKFPDSVNPLPQGWHHYRDFLKKFE